MLREIYGLFEQMEELSSYFQSWMCLIFVY